MDDITFANTSKSTLSWLAAVTYSQAGDQAVDEDCFQNAEQVSCHHWSTVPDDDAA
jgi:hypothetical protein